MTRIWKWLDDTDIKSWWAVAAIVLGAVQFSGAIILDRWTIAGWPRPSLVGAVIGMIFGVGHFAGQRWSRWFCVAWVGLLLVAINISAIELGWTFGRFFQLMLWVGMAIGCYFVFFRERHVKDAANDEAEPFLSLVLLLREPSYLDATILAALASRAWGIEVTSGGDRTEPDEENSENEREQADASEASEDEQRAFIVGEAPLYMGMHPSAMFIIHQRDEPYVENLDEVAQQIDELRARQAVLAHRAWIAVDVMHWFGEGNGIEESYRLIARLLAELADDNVLAIVDPDASRIFSYDPETEQKLKSDSPLTALREWYYSPIVEVSAEDPRMQAAVAEAQRRWPEFVAAFESRGTDDDTPFAIKAPFGTDENREFMWVEVTGIENEIVYGVLKNEPAGIPELHEGDRVKVAVANVNDWLAVVGEEPVGGFTIKVLAEQAQRPRGAGDE